MSAITMPSQAGNDDRCKTHYPIILLHGIGYRDDMFLMASWGRIPAALQAAGARVFLGGLDAWNTHENSAAKLKPQVEEVLQATGADKVNLIAHSKGGLEARFMISKLGMAQKVASLTTVCTPHHGTSVADLVTGAVPDRLGLLRTNLFKFLAQKLGFRALVGCRKSFDRLDHVYFETYSFPLTDREYGSAKQ